MLKQLLEALGEQLTEHWVKMLTAAAFMVLGWYFGRFRERKQWKKREFLNRVNISLTTIEQGTLKIRTLIEKEANEVFLNSHAVQQVRQFAEQTVPGKPLLPIPTADYWFYLNPVLNEIAEKYSAGQIAAEAGKPVTRVLFLMCLTCEAEGAVRTRKIRAMVVRKDLLLNLPEKMPKLESPAHETRWSTLKAMAAAYEHHPDQFQEIEILVP